MGGGAQKQQITESEIASAENRDRQWEEYLKTRPIQDEYMRKATGMVSDGNGGLKVGTNQSVLNPDGSVMINTSSSQMATEQAATQMTLQQYASGNIDQAIDDNVELATGEANDSATSAFQQQSNYLQGIDNVALMGQGEETELTVGQLDQAAQDNQSAAARAQSINERRAANRQAAGQLAGAGLGAYSQYNAGTTQSSAFAGDGQLKQNL